MFGFLKLRDKHSLYPSFKASPEVSQTYSFHVSCYDRLDIKDPESGPQEVHLMNGREFALKTPKSIQKIIFTDEPVKLDRMNFDASMEQDGSVIAWIEQNVMYVTSGRKGIPIMAPRDSRCMFIARDELETVDFGNLDFSTAEEFSTMFANCKKLRYLDMSKCDVSNATCFNEMFGNCSKLRYLRLDGWSTSKCKNFDKMFLNCECLRVVDLSHFDTTSALSTSNMFAGCSRLTSVIMGDFKVPEANEDQKSKFYPIMSLSCNSMFARTPSLTTLVASDPRIIEEFLEKDPQSSPVRNIINLTEWTPKVADELSIYVEVTPPVTECVR